MTNQEILDKREWIWSYGVEARTQSMIIWYMQGFIRIIDKPAEQMGENEIRLFLHYLLTEKKDTPATVNTYNSALRFLYGETLDIALNLKKIPRVKQNRSIAEKIFLPARFADTLSQGLPRVGQPNNYPARPFIGEGEAIPFIYVFSIPTFPCFINTLPLYHFVVK